MNLWFLLGRMRNDVHRRGHAIVPHSLFFSALMLLTCSVSCSDEVDEPTSRAEMPAEQAFLTGLPVVRITTPDSVDIRSKTEWIENADVEILAPDGMSLLHGKTWIRGRGNVTWKRYPKKPYSLKFNEKVSLFGLPASKRWVLLANWVDRTLLRNDVAFEVARRTSLAWTPQGRAVELILNGKFRGQYYLSEKIKVEKHRVNIDEMSSADNEGRALTGGYLLELDSYFDEQNKFRSAKFELPYQFRSPDDEELTSEQFNYMQNYIEAMELALADSSRLVRGDYEQWLDPVSLADWWIVNELVYNKEVGRPKSVYVYKPRGDRLYFGPVWDYDWATFTSHTSLYVARHFPYLKVLFKTERFTRLAKERWLLLRDTLSTIPAYIDRKADDTRLSNEINHQMWPIKHTTSNHDEKLSFDEAIERMKDAYMMRMKVIDSFFETDD